MKLEQRYADLRNPIGFAGRSIISRYTKNLSGKKLRNRLAHIPTYVLHREAKRPRTYNPFILYQSRDLIQADLIDMVKHGKYNKNYKYIFVVVDSFTRFCWAEAVLSKTSTAILELFKKICKKIGPFKRFMTDAGSEFIAGNFQAFLKEQNIEFIRGNPHAPHVERLNRTLQGRLFKYMTENETNEWVRALQPTVEGYNTRYHRIIRMSPADAERKKNRSKLIANLTLYYDKALKKRKDPKFKVGDVVSMQKEKSNFGKGYTQVFTDELFKIYLVHSKLPIPMYTLVEYDYDFEAPETLKEKMIKGRFYENELQSAKYDVFKVEKIVRSQVKNGVRGSVVKWKGWPDKYNSWVANSEIKDIYGVNSKKGAKK